MTQYQLIPECNWNRRLADGTLKRSFGGPSINLGFQSRDIAKTPSVRVTYQRGFVNDWIIQLPNDLIACSIREALRQEPVTRLTLDFGLDSIVDEWSGMSDPSLCQIRDLNVGFSSEGLPHSLRAICRDPHFAGVRKLVLSGSGDAIESAILAEFGRSRLARKLDELKLYPIDETGLREMLGSNRFQWKKLDLFGSFDAATLAQLAKSGLARTLKYLSLNGSNLLVRCHLGDEGLSAIEQLTQLKGLSLTRNGITSLGLMQLAKAPFASCLEWLDLSNNPILDGTSDLKGLRELSSALNPDCLRWIRLSQTGLAAIPDFLESRFDKRVSI